MQLNAVSAPTLRADEAFRAQREAEAIAVKALATTRNALSLTESAFHDAITGAKTQIPALYGEDSDEVAALGLKKRSEKKTGGRAELLSSMAVAQRWSYANILKCQIFDFYSNNILKV